MRINRQAWIIRALLVLVVAAGVSSCSSMGRRSSAQGSTALRVQNDIIPSVALRIYAVSLSGGRTLVGSVNPGATTTLYFDPIGASGQYQFVAQVSLGREIVSNPVAFSDGDTIEWNVRSNLATVAGRE
jgi:hypothetical protein